MIGNIFGVIASLVIAQPVHAEMTVQHYLYTLPQAQDVQRPAPPKPPIKRRPESIGVRTSGTSVFVADMSTGSVLYAKDPHRVQSIASLTKLVTAMVFLDLKPDMTKSVVLIEEDFDRETKSIFKAGEEMTYEDLLRSMLVGSVNASSNIIARTTLGKEAFVRAMNEKARSIGLRSPIFVEPSGIDPLNRANAADVAAIISTASSYPEIRELSQKAQVVVRDRITKKESLVKSTNLLLSTYVNKKPFSIVAAKTGSLPEAGFCMAQITQNAEGHQIIVVELGSDNHFSRYQDIKALTSWAFETYTWE